MLEPAPPLEPVLVAVTVLPVGETTYHLAPKASTACPLSCPADVSPLKK